MSSLQLREGEELKAFVIPHPLAFADFYAVFSYITVLAIIFIFYREQILDWMLSLPVVGWFPEELFTIFWACCVILPFLTVAIVKIVWRWFFFSLILVSAGLTATFLLKWPLEYMQLPLISGGVLGILLTEKYRRGHRFYVTSQRIISELRFLSYKRRELTYGKITDVAMAKGVLGSLFGFGTIFPVTASGFGLGEDLAAVTAGVGLTSRGVTAGTAVTGGRTVSVPRGRSFHTLFGVPRPEEICSMIAKYVYEHEEAPYLKRFSEKVGSIKEKGKPKS
jgi:hypothetical protein